MEVGIIGHKGVEGKETAHAPLVQAVLHGSFRKDAEEDLGEEKRYGVLVHPVPDTGKGVQDRYPGEAPKFAFWVFPDIGLKQVQGKETGHTGLFAGADKESAPAELTGQGMHNQCAFAHFGATEYYEFNVLHPGGISPWPTGP